MDLSGVELKVWRAHRHTTELKSALKTSLDPERYAITSKSESDTGTYVYSVKQVPPIDVEWAPLVGEILFDLRSALDHLAWQLVLLDGKTPGEQTQFPIYDSPRDKQGKLRAINLRPAVKDPKIIAALEKVQPYEAAPNEPSMHGLQRLHLMNNWDKHRLLLLVVQVLDTGHIWWGANEGDPRPKGEFSVVPLKDGSPVAWFDFGDHERPPHFDPHLALEVAIEEPLTPDGSKTRLVHLGPLMESLYWWVTHWTVEARFLHLFPPSTKRVSQETWATVPPVKGYM
jgi:hypothetical protein